MATIPEGVRELLKGTVFWHLATLNKDGSAQTTPVWADVDDGHVIVNTAIGRRKEKNARRDPRVALSVTNPENPYTWIVLGRAFIMSRITVALPCLSDEHSIEYIGQDVYPY